MKDKILDYIEQNATQSCNFNDHDWVLDLKELREFISDIEESPWIKINEDKSNLPPLESIVDICIEGVRYFDVEMDYHERFGMYFYDNVGDCKIGFEKQVYYMYINLPHKE
jgi:hypothetical protein